MCPYFSKWSENCQALNCRTYVYLTFVVISPWLIESTCSNAVLVLILLLLCNPERIISSFWSLLVSYAKCLFDVLCEYKTQINTDLAIGECLEERMRGALQVCGTVYFLIWALVTRGIHLVEIYWTVHLWIFHFSIFMFYSIIFFFKDKWSTTKI